MKSRHIKRLAVISIIFAMTSTLVISTPSHASSTSADTKKNIALIRKLGAEESNLIARYNAVTGTHFKNDSITTKAFIGMLPDLNVFIAAIQDLAPKDPKLQNAVTLWAQAWDKEELGITLAIAAMQGKDYAKLASSNAALSAAHVLENKAMAAFAPFLK